MIYRANNTLTEVRIGASIYPVKWVDRYSLLMPGCLIVHRVSQHERYVDEVLSSDFVPISNPVPGLYVKVNRAHDVHYIHEAEILHVRAFSGGYVEKLNHAFAFVATSNQIDESDYWIMRYSYQQLVVILPDWVRANERIMVNHLRHYHSNYEKALKSMRDTGADEKYISIFTWFNNEIGRYYPDLMPECRRQIEEKLKA